MKQRMHFWNWTLFFVRRWRLYCWMASTVFFFWHFEKMLVFLHGLHRCERLQRDLGSHNEMNLSRSCSASKMTLRWFLATWNWVKWEDKKWEYNNCDRLTCSFRREATILGDGALLLTQTAWLKPEMESEKWKRVSRIPEAWRWQKQVRDLLGIMCWLISKSLPSFHFQSVR